MQADEVGQDPRAELFERAAGLSEGTGMADAAPDRRKSASFGPDDDTPVFVISVAAQLAGMHAQTLRQYDRLGLVSPSRTRGGGRRYSGRDVALLREVQRLSQEEGVSLAGIQRILELRSRWTPRGPGRVARALDEPGPRIFTADPRGDVVAVPRGSRSRRPRRSDRAAVVLWRPSNR